MWFGLKRSPPSNFLRLLQLARSTRQEFLKWRILGAAHLFWHFGDHQNYQFQWWVFSKCVENDIETKNIKFNHDKQKTGDMILFSNIDGFNPWSPSISLHLDTSPLVQLFNSTDLHIESCPSHPHLDHHIIIRSTISWVNKPKNSIQVCLQKFES